MDAKTADEGLDCVPNDRGEHLPTVHNDNSVVEVKSITMA